MKRRLLVDAMNVIGSRPDRWWNDPERAMRRFAVAVDKYAEGTEDDLTVVFDKDPTELPPLPNIEVALARRKGRNAADHEIEQIVKASEDPSSLTVVTSDKRLVERVQALGAEVVRAGVFRDRLEPHR